METGLVVAARRSSPRDFNDQAHTHARGRVAEQAGVEWLLTQGYRIEERNLRNAAGEIDVVAWDGETLCFIEVKARETDRYGQAIETVPRQKQTRIGRVASLYLVRYDDAPPECRFDVLAMDGEGEAWRFTLVRDAFVLGS